MATKDIKEGMLVAFALISILSLIAAINAIDINRCVELGNSYDECQRAFNR